MKIKKLKKRSKILVKAKVIAEQVEMNREEYSKLSIKDLKIRTDYLINGIKENKFDIDDIVVDAFSIAREIIFRVYGMLAYPVQMMGAYVAHCGDFAEMYTGEGKTVTIMLVSFLNALAKRGVHVVTVNEYLVQRDAEIAAKAFEPLGITVGYNTSQLAKEVKKEMFARDITYTTNSELGFDYLRDNMVRSISEKVIRELFFVIIDEGDSVLIDEARTPLIISGMPKEDYSLYLDVDKIVSSLKPEDYFIDLESNTISLTDTGTQKVESFFNLKNLYSVESSEIVHKVTNALVAHYVFANGREYIVKDNKIYLVDQFTGRVLEGRSYNAGLQQAIQAKERVQIEPENVVMATITYQSFFRLYKRLSAFSGTAMTESEEFLKIYNMVVVRIPTNKPIIRIDKPDYIFGTKEVKWNHVIEEIVRRHKTGQPILVGTSSVSDSELIHQRLKEMKIPHEVLNARDNSKEAEIVKRGGQLGAITISTNMAGRGTDIKVAPECLKLGGLYVIGTERHESRRIDNQLRGRTGRQGDPGESRFFTSLEDSIFKRFASDRYEKAAQKLENEFHDWTFFTSFLNRTQKKIEGLNFDVRKNLMDYDHVLSLQRELVYKQRDQILLETKNLGILSNMAKEYATDLVYQNKNVDNSAIIDHIKLCELINSKFLKFEYFKPEDFEGLVLNDARDVLVNIFNTIVETKANILKEINALNVIGEILLVNLDQKWTTHIDKMTKLREGVNLRSLEQRSPLNIYIEDGNNLFEKMKSDVVRDVINGICDLNLPNESNEITEALQKNNVKDISKKKMIEQPTQENNLNLNNYDNEINEEELNQYELFIETPETPEKFKDVDPESLVPNYLIGEDGDVVDIKNIEETTTEEPNLDSYYENYIEDSDYSSYDQFDDNLNNNDFYEAQPNIDEYKDDYKFKFNDIFKEEEPKKDKVVDQNYFDKPYLKIDQVLEDVVNDSEKETLMDKNYVPLDKLISNLSGNNIDVNNIETDANQNQDFLQDNQYDYELSENEIYTSKRVLDLEYDDKLKDLSLWEDEKERLNVLFGDNNNEVQEEIDEFDRMLLEDDGTNTFVESIENKSIMNSLSNSDENNIEKQKELNQNKDTSYYSPASLSKIIIDKDNIADIPKDQLKKNPNTDEVDYETLFRSFKIEPNHLKNDTEIIKEIVNNNKKILKNKKTFNQEIIDNLNGKK
ncbi:preprotein translocase subunit SecA [Malacoplasma iowae]|nr:preprotein translocase subunit SecA [Malacoplasma iowae]WPL40189.1 preprotein translocase subunit SecA [Malacoplasma iowae]